MKNAILIDLDGVLVNLRLFRFSCLNAALVPYGLSVTIDEQETAYAGLPDRAILELLAERKGLDRRLFPIILASRDQHLASRVFDHYGEDSKLQALILTLRAYGLQIAVCADLPCHVVNSAVAALGLTSWVDVAVGSAQGNPFALASKALKRAPEECVAVLSNPFSLLNAVQADIEDVVHIADEFVLANVRPYLAGEPVLSSSMAA